MKEDKPTTENENPNIIARDKRWKESAAPQFTSEHQPNNRGRPKGSMSITVHLRKLLSEHKEKEAIALSKAIIKHAKAGKAGYANMVLDRVDGVLRQEIDHTGSMTLLAPEGIEKK